MARVAAGEDPQAERKAERTTGTFGELAERYLVYAQKKNKSWRQADALVKRHLLPRWANLQTVTRADVKAVMARCNSPTTANQVLASASAIFSWGVREELVATNPCIGIERNPTSSRERILSDSEIPAFWEAFDSVYEGSALKVLLLTGQRPGEVSHMRTEHIRDGWWVMPGAPVPALGWPGTKNGNTHQVWIPVIAQEIIAAQEATGFVFTGPRGRAMTTLDGAMRDICKASGAERTTPHDLRRTHGSKVAKLFGREVMNRVENHREGGIADVYDRNEYAEENQKAMETVANAFMTLIEGKPDNVVALRK
jgi:integrase